MPKAELEGPPTEEVVLTAAKFNGFAEPNAPVKPPPTAHSGKPKEMKEGEEDTGVPDRTLQPEGTPENNFGYTVNEHGTITDPGQFEGEPRWLPYFVDCMMNGGCGEEIGGGEDGTIYNAIEITPEALTVYPEELKGIYGVIVWQSYQGFWNQRTFETAEAYQAGVYDCEDHSSDDEGMSPEDEGMSPEDRERAYGPRAQEESARERIDRQFEMKSGTWDVYVGNIGNVYSGPNELKARAIFKEYMEQSSSKGGRAAGEDVTLMMDGEPVSDYTGSISKNNPEP
jgi:hypothetical protein